MSAATDTFARFVDVLAESLDDHDASGEELASRLHLSRFHFDRLVSAAAGEPPATLRRRVLLERAAYRLITTDDDVLGVAVEAGYSSHEAFTRAFARAYGEAPSRWRRRPTGFRLDAPSERALPPTGEPASPRREKGDRHGSAHTHGRAPHLAGRRDARRGPSGSPTTCSTRPSRSRSRASTATRRCARCCPGWSARWRCGTPPRTTGPTTSASRRARPSSTCGRGWPRSGPAFLAQVREIVDEGRLDETFVDAICDPPEVFTYGGMVAHVLTFAAHRRTLVCGALIDAGIDDLGAGDPMRWVAEHA